MKSGLNPILNMIVLSAEFWLYKIGIKRMERHRIKKKGDKWEKCVCYLC